MQVSETIMGFALGNLIYDLKLINLKSNLTVEIFFLKYNISGRPKLLCREATNSGEPVAELVQKSASRL